ncbi:MAG: 1-deoxy-D-xylulose-5-phosphate reductoisomerase [Tidjanibacter sp.]|nr:1-deoxy-D-xylulose-5-phosphate reductoisomerase [Tidjanibacter sp.]
MKQRLALLGSTGSIGQQTLDIVRQRPEEFEVTTLTAARSWERLVEQAKEFQPDNVVIADKSLYGVVSEALKDEPVKIYAGDEALSQVVASGEVDTVVNALVGYAGMLPSLSAVRAGKRLALANKESLVVAGELIMKEAAERNVPILPIDSEHSAIFQCLLGEVSPVRRVIITASGGPFLRTPAEELKNVTVEQALAHPNWSMGAKITIDSSTLVNKGFEVIEAKWLFGLKPEQIDVLVHPQSIVHSMVEFDDGAIKAQLGAPDMHLPIQFALRFPHRGECGESRFSFADNPTLTFEKVDDVRFPMLSTAYECLRKGGNSCCVMNGANEVAVASFLGGRIKYIDIANVIQQTLSRATFVARPSVEDYALSNEESRRIAEEIVRGICNK